MEEFDALVTGGSGFLWKYILMQPLSSRFRLCFLGRTAPDERARFEFIDLASDGAVRSANLGSLRSRVFLHFAAPTPAPVARIPLEEADRMARNAASIALLCGAERLIHASSGAVYGVSWQGFRTEQDPAAPSTDYGRAKKSAEDSIDEIFACEAAGRRAVHLRFHFPAPSIESIRQAAQEPDCNRLYARLARDIVGGSPITLESSEYWMNPCPGPAVVKLLELLLGSEEPGTRLLNVAGSRSWTLERIALEMGKHLGRSPRFEWENGPERSMLVDTGLFRSLVGNAVDLPLF